MTCMKCGVDIPEDQVFWDRCLSVMDEYPIKPGTHISCVGADMSGKQEIDEQILADARVFGDDAQQCFSVGECESAYKAGLLNRITEIGEVIAGAATGRMSDEEITVFDSTGIALQDLASAAVILKKAEKQNMGTVVEL